MSGMFMRGVSLSPIADCTDDVEVEEFRARGRELDCTATFAITSTMLISHVLVWFPERNLMAYKRLMGDASLMAGDTLTITYTLRPEEFVEMNNGNSTVDYR